MGFKSFFQYGASQKESMILKAMKTFIYNFLSHLSGVNSERDDAWEKYGAYDAQTNCFEFFPNMLIEPLKYRVEFQEMMFHTQLFVTYAQEKQSIINKKQEKAKIIASWLENRMSKHRK